MKVEKLQSLTEKGSASPVQVSTHTGKGIHVSKSGSKIISPFCEFCNPVDGSEKQRTDVFPDKYGFLWKCGKPLVCPHAITDGPVIVDCMILRKILRTIPGNVHDIDPRYKTKRRKIRAQLSQDLKMITGMREAVPV